PIVQPVVQPVVVQPVFQPICPPVDFPKSNATILPDPHNCTAFYICSNGVAHHLACPSELQFNNNLKVCDWPENVNCLDNGSGDILNLI
ncbi:hypothetical protein BIW11_11052, partial [Tropilaelaps mercedesae]